MISQSGFHCNNIQIYFIAINLKALWNRSIKSKVSIEHFQVKQVNKMSKINCSFIQVQVGPIVWEEPVGLGLLSQGDNGLQPIVTTSVVRKCTEFTTGVTQERSQHPWISQTTWRRKRWPRILHVEPFGQSKTKYSVRKQPPTTSANLIKSESISKVSFDF